jgi:hypothetical protein
VSLVPLQDWLLGQLTGETRAWYERALASAAAAGGEAFAGAWSACGRRLGRAALTPTQAEAETLTTAGAPFVPAGWGMDEAGRAVLLLVTAQRGATGAGGADPGTPVEEVGELFAHGELREQQAVVRVLAYLPEPARYSALAADAVRTNALPVLEALACDNPFPARHMPDLAFNQLIMKAIFNGLPLGRVLALPERNNAELKRMVGAYASERRAAGRPVPADVDFILGGAPNASV